MAAIHRSCTGRIAALGLVSILLPVAIAAADLTTLGDGEVIPDYGASPTIVSVADGSWSDPASWSPQRQPGNGDVVQVSDHITYDADDLADSLADVSILNGASLTFRTDIPTGMLVANLQVHEGGSLAIGTISQPVAAGVEATLIIADQALDLGADPDQFGTSLLGFGRSAPAERRRPASSASMPCRMPATPSPLTRPDGMAAGRPPGRPRQPPASSTPRPASISSTIPRRWRSPRCPAMR